MSLIRFTNAYIGNVFWAIECEQQQHARCLSRFHGDGQHSDTRTSAHLRRILHATFQSASQTHTQ